MKQELTILWFRKDLRLDDHPALVEAAGRGAVLPVFVFDEEASTLGRASRWWLHGALADMKTSFAERGVPFLLRRGRAAEVLPRLVRESGAGAVFWSRRYDPEGRAEEEAVTEALGSATEARGFPGALLFEPESICNGSGSAYKVFTPFSKTCFAAPPPAPWGLPRKIVAGPDLKTENLEAWGLASKAESFGAFWNPSQKGAAESLRVFLKSGLQHYEKQRDIPGVKGTSQLSPALVWGQIGVRRVWQSVERALQKAPLLAGGGRAFQRQLLWRDFANHLLFAYPFLGKEPLNPAFRTFPWREDKADLVAWQEGRTGYPFLDAGLRQLRQTGWMHNRVRMVVGSFLVKDLRLRWQEGAAWFGETLLDADPANNAFGWQWVGGCGADAAPYFRIFNPVLQSRRFDPSGDYIRTFVPELAALPSPFLHAPWKAPAHILAKAGVTLGKTYPKPRVDHDAARTAALAAYRDRDLR